MCRQREHSRRVLNFGGAVGLFVAAVASTLLCPQCAMDRLTHRQRQLHRIRSAQQDAKQRALTFSKLPESQAAHADRPSSSIQQQQTSPAVACARRTLSTAEADAATLEHEGFRVLRGVLAASASDVRAWERAVERRGGPIFNARGNRKRTQVSLPAPAPAGLAAIAAAAAPALTITDCVVLRSELGCAPQPAHCDYDPVQIEASAPPSGVPCGLLCGLHELTVFDAWPSSWKTVRAGAGVRAADRVQVRLSAGDALVFRGDLVHAGAEWPPSAPPPPDAPRDSQTARGSARGPNVRLHAYLDAEGIPRAQNRTYRVKVLDDTVPDAAAQTS